MLFSTGASKDIKVLASFRTSLEGLLALSAASPEELIFGGGDEDSNFQFSESGGSLNGLDLFTDLAFLWKCVPSPSFTECHPPLFIEPPFSSLRSASSHPLPKSAHIRSCRSVIFFYFDFAGF